MTEYRIDKYGYPQPVTPKAADGLSPDRRRTLRQRNDIEAGRHPVTGLPLIDPGWGYTCADCAHLTGHQRHNGSGNWWKCDLRDTASAATDVRLKWPACARFRIDQETGL